MDLVGLLKRPEDKTLEFKRELSAPEGALRTIVAFASTAGGTLLVGVENRTGHVRGITEPLDLEERLANLISDRVVPRLVPEIEILPWRRPQVLAVGAHPSPSRPHFTHARGTRYRGLRACGRHQPASRPGAHRGAPPIDARRSLRRAADARPQLGSSGLPIRFRVVCIRPQDQLPRSRNAPPRDAPPGAHGAHRGGAPFRIAIFDDRLGVQNPGLLPFGLTVEDLPRRVAKLRNRAIGRVFHLFGLIEQSGSGVERMTRACREAGLTPLIFGEIGTRFRVTLSTARVGPPVLDETGRAIVDALAAGKGLLTSEIAKAIGLTPGARLIASGLVREVGTRPQDPKRHY